MCVCVCICNKFLSFWLVNCPASGNCSGTPFILRYGLINAKLGFQAMLSCATLRFFSLTDQCYIPIFRIGYAAEHSKFTEQCHAQILMEDNLRWKTTFNGRRPSMEDDLQWKTTFNGRRPSMEDDFQWKPPLNGRWPSMEDTLQWKTPFNGRWPSMEDHLQWKTTFNGRWPSMENDLQLKTTFNGRKLSK